MLGKHGTYLRKPLGKEWSCADGMRSTHCMGKHMPYVYYDHKLLYFIVRGLEVISIF